MKKVIFILTVALAAMNSFAQMPDKFVKAIESKLAAVDSTATVSGWVDLANSFERIAEAEKNQWLAYYYAAYSHVMAGLLTGSGGDMMVSKADKTDPFADKADAMMKKAEALIKANSEIYVIKKMIATLRMMGDPMNRFQTYGPEAQEYLETAKKMNPDNPRVYILEGQDKFYTPEQFGGSKEEAKILFETALKKFESFKPESTIHPSWGQPAVKYFMSQMK